MCARRAHARNTLEERWARWTSVRSTRVCAHGPLVVRYTSFSSFPLAFPVIWGVRYTSVDENTTHARVCSACVPRVSRVCVALAQRALRMAGVLMVCAFMRRAPRTALRMHTNPDAHNERRQMHSVGPARSTHE